MPIEIADLQGLNATEMRAQAILLSAAHAERLRREAVDHGVSVVGSNHSQGGHTALRDGLRLSTLPYWNRAGAHHSIADPLQLGTVSPQAGATWTQLHEVLGPYGRAPLVQQSSGGFSVGGSVSVNCHGRDPRWGPLSSVIDSVTVLTGRGDVVKASRSEHPDLFAAAVGGYGACGLILDATVRVGANPMLFMRGHRDRRDASDFVAAASGLNGRPEVQLFWGWLSCLRGRLFEQCLVAELVTPDPPVVDVGQWQLKEERWGEGEQLRGAWEAARDDDEARRLAWEIVREMHGHNQFGRPGGNGTKATRIDWMRASVSFLGGSASGATVDMLQEYFVPPAELPRLLAALKAIFEDPTHRINVLSATLRTVKADDETVLSYCPGGDRISVALEAAVPVVGSGTQRDVHQQAKAGLVAAIRAALNHGGSYYLPYARVADRALLREAYPGHERLQQAIDAWNPRGPKGKHSFWNGFLDAYFD